MSKSKADFIYSTFHDEALAYQAWADQTPIPPIPVAVAQEGAGSESRTPLMHYGTVLPVYLGIIRHIQSLDLKKGDKLIELGCGSGRLLAYLKVVFPMLDIYGVDYSKDCVEYAKIHYGTLGIKCKIMKPGKTPFPDASFRFVISSHVIEHIPVDEGLTFMQEVARLLQPDGIAFIGTPERRMCQNLFHLNPTDDPQFRLVPPHEHEYTLEELKALAVKVFKPTNVTIDKLRNPLFHQIFLKSIKNIRPGTSKIHKLRHRSYQLMTHRLPRPLFDTITRTGAALTMKRYKLTYQNILLANTIVPESSKMIADNLLLICKK